MPVHPPIHFPAEPEFGAWDAAEIALRDAGFSIGSMKAHYPRGILLGDVTIAKWHNLTKAEQAQCHAQAWGCRDGSVTVMIHADCPADIVPRFAPVRAAAERRGIPIAIAAPAMTAAPAPALQGILLIAPTIAIIGGVMVLTPGFGR